MLISVDGPMGSGKTSLVTLLASFFKGSEFVRLDALNKDKEKREALYPLEKWASTAINEGREFFETAEYDDKNLSQAMLLLYTARLKVIQANKALRNTEHVFLDTFFDPLWVLDHEYVKTYFQWLQDMVELPNISFFLDINSKMAYKRRIGESGKVSEEYQQKYEAWDKKRSYFCGFGEKNIPNFHALQAGRPIAEVLDQAIRIIVNYKEI